MANVRGHRNVRAVLDDASATLDTARLGVEDFRRGDRPGRRLAGLRNAVVFGRAVTNAVQNIRRFEREGFERWYGPRQAALRENTDFKYLVELRNQILKEGVLGSTSASMMIEDFNTNQLAELPTPPAGAKSFFMGDHLGGSGWEVDLADGTKERYYIELPTTWKIRTEAHFTDVTTSLGLPPPKKPIDHLLVEYMDQLTDLIAAARLEFLN